MQKSEIHILSGPINSGKTTLLLEWSKRRRTAGILTPRSANGRLFYDTSTEKTFPMEASGDEEVLEVGQFRFSKKAFQQAAEIIRTAALDERTDWLIIDEIGPMELKGEGFSEVLREVLKANKSIRIILVVREKLVNEVIETFRLQNVHIFKM